MSSYLKEAPYYNCMIVSPDGRKLGFCNRKKELSYLRKGLATIVSGQETRTIKLNFLPSWGNRLLIDGDLIPRDNVCVVCGKTENLTKHHIVPSCYRNHLPLYLKEHNPYDVMAICIPDHNNYERNAEELKRELAIEFGTTAPFAQNEKILVAKSVSGAATALLKHNDMIPEERRAVLRKRVESYLGRSPNKEDLINLSEMSKSINGSLFSHGAEVVGKLNGIEDFNRFIIRWRLHFVRYAKPRLLPKGWFVDRRFVESKEI